MSWLLCAGRSRKHKKGGVAEELNGEIPNENGAGKPQLVKLRKKSNLEIVQKAQSDLQSEYRRSRIDREISNRSLSQIKDGQEQLKEDLKVLAENLQRVQSELEASKLENAQLKQNEREQNIRWEVCLEGERKLREITIKEKDKDIKELKEKLQTAESDKTNFFQKSCALATELKILKESRNSTNTDSNVTCDHCNCGTAVKSSNLKNLAFEQLRQCLRDNAKLEKKLEDVKAEIQGTFELTKEGKDEQVKIISSINALHQQTCKDNRKIHDALSHIQCDVLEILDGGIKLKKESAKEVEQLNNCAEWPKEIWRLYNILKERVGPDWAEFASNLNLAPDFVSSLHDSIKDKPVVDFHIVFLKVMVEWKKKEDASLHGLLQACRKMKIGNLESVTPMSTLHRNILINKASYFRKNIRCPSLVPYLKDTGILSTAAVEYILEPKLEEYQVERLLDVACFFGKDGFGILKKALKEAQFEFVVKYLEDEENRLSTTMSSTEKTVVKKDTCDQGMLNDSKFSMLDSDSQCHVCGKETDDISIIKETIHKIEKDIGQIYHLLHHKIGKLQELSIPVAPFYSS